MGALEPRSHRVSKASSTIMERTEEPSLETKVSHYRLVRRLGAGGKGEVYVGLDETLKRRVVLKAVHPGQRLFGE
jgi:serine/threonine protein kinase